MERKNILEQKLERINFELSKLRECEECKFKRGQLNFWEKEKNKVEYLLSKENEINYPPLIEVGACKK